MRLHVGQANVPRSEGHARAATRRAGSRSACGSIPTSRQAHPPVRRGHGARLSAPQEANGDVWQTDLWQAGMGIVDFTNPEALQVVCRASCEQLLRHGRGLLQDRLWRAHPRTRRGLWYDGSDPLQDAQLLRPPVQQAWCSSVSERELRRGQGRACSRARATAGGQQFPVHWGGDNCRQLRLHGRDPARRTVAVPSAASASGATTSPALRPPPPADLYKRWCCLWPAVQPQPPARLSQLTACPGCSTRRAVTCCAHFTQPQVPPDALPVSARRQGARARASQ